MALNFLIRYAETLQKQIPHAVIQVTKSRESTLALYCKCKPLLNVTVIFSNVLFLFQTRLTCNPMVHLLGSLAICSSARLPPPPLACGPAFCGRTARVNIVSLFKHSLIMRYSERENMCVHVLEIEPSASSAKHMFCHTLCPQSVLLLVMSTWSLGYIGVCCLSPLKKGPFFIFKFRPPLRPCNTVSSCTFIL